MYLFRLVLIGTLIEVGLCSVLRHNYGVNLDPTDLKAYTRIVPQTIELNFPLRNLEKPNEFEINLELCEQLMIEPKELTAWHEGMENINTNIYNAIQEILTSITRSPRRRRAPGLKFLGDILFACCGVMTIDAIEDEFGSINNNAKVIDVLKHGANRRNNQLYLLASAHTRTNKFLKNSTTTVKALMMEQADALIQVFLNLTGDIDQHRNFTQEIIKRNVNVHELILNLLNQEQYQIMANNFLNILADIQRSYLPRVLLSDKELNKIVQKLTGMLQVENKNGILLGDMNQWRKQIFGYVFNDTLIVKITLFYSYGLHVFDILKPIIFPIPIHASDHEDQGYTILNYDTNTLFAISQDQEYYINLHDNVKSPCRKIGKDWMCFASMTVTHIQEPSCMSALYEDNPVDIMQYCSFLSFPEKLPRVHIPLAGESHLLINYGEKGDLICEGQPSSYLRLSSFAFVDVPCGCELKMKGAILASKYALCDMNKTYTVTVRTGLNLPIAMTFNIPVPKFKGGSLRATFIRYNIPNSQYIFGTLTEISKNEMDKGVELTRLFQEYIAKDAKALATWRPQIVKTPEKSFRMIAGIVYGIMVFVSVLSSSYLHYKVHMFSTILSTLYTHSNAAKLDVMGDGEVVLSPQHQPVHNMSRTGTMTGSHDMDAGYDRLKPLIYFLLICLAVVAWKVIRRCWRRCMCCFGASCCRSCSGYTKYDKDAAWLCLRVKVGRHAATMRLTQLAQEDDGVLITSAPRCKITKVSWGFCPCWKPRATLEWKGRQSVYNARNRTEIPLPSSVAVDSDLRAIVASYSDGPEGDAAFLMVSSLRVNTIPWDPIGRPFNPAIGEQNPAAVLNVITTPL